MTRRLLYHVFWNFYDYLGTFLLLGLVSTAVVAALLFGGAALAAAVPGGGGVVAMLTLLLCLVLLAWVAAGFFAFASKAARDEPARLPDFRQGARSLFGSYLKVAILWGLAMAVVGSNIWFYSHLASSLPSDGARAALGVASMLFFWIGVGVCLCAMSVAAVPARFPEQRSVREILRRGVMLFLVLPGVWLVAGVVFAGVALLCAASVVGLIFALPLLAVLSSTALDLVARFVEDLSKARAELGEGKPVRAYKRRALELGWEWEYRQPRRTLRELIRPWET